MSERKDKEELLVILNKEHFKLGKSLPLHSIEIATATTCTVTRGEQGQFRVRECINLLVTSSTESLGESKQFQATHCGFNGGYCGESTSHLSLSLPPFSSSASASSSSQTNVSGTFQLFTAEFHPPSRSNTVDTRHLAKCPECNKLSIIKRPKVSVDPMPRPAWPGQVSKIWGARA